jgi:predicted secreted protein
VFESLPSQFNAFKTTYNAQRDEWSLSEMAAIVTQEKVMKKGKSHAVFYDNKRW